MTPFLFIGRRLSSAASAGMGSVRAPCWLRMCGRMRVCACAASYGVKVVVHAQPSQRHCARPEAPKISSRVPSLKPEAASAVGAGEAELEVDVADVELDESERDLDEFEGEDPELDDPDEGEFEEEAPEDAEAEALLLSDDDDSFDELYIVDGGVGSWMFVVEATGWLS